MFLPDEQGELATITLRNLTDRPLLVGRDGGCEFEPFDLLDASGRALQWHRGSCATTCEAIAKGECVYCGACAGSTFLRLDPGAEFSVEWAQTEIETVELPSDCVDACDPSCGRPDMVAAGEYAFTSFAREVCEDEACSCPAGESACTLTLEDVELQELQELQERTVLSPLPTNAVEIVFE